MIESVNVTHMSCESILWHYRSEGGPDSRCGYSGRSKMSINKTVETKQINKCINDKVDVETYSPHQLCGEKGSEHKCINVSNIKDMTWSQAYNSAANCPLCTSFIDYCHWNFVTLKALPEHCRSDQRIFPQYKKLQ